ncbi:MAG: Fic family protein [Acidobacteriota bacterium]
MIVEEQPAGKMIRTATGYDAFMPDRLPPRLEWTPRLLQLLSEADQAIGRLSGEGRHLPHPHLLIRAFVRKEAVLSSRIEGTLSTLDDIMASEAGAPVERDPEDLREVANYVTAMEHGLQRLETLPLSLRLVRELHERLMEGVRGQAATPGEFRRSQNWIGPAGCSLTEATYLPPPPDQMHEALHDWEEFLHDRSLPPLVQIGLAHYQFEAIHPFLDGNGRVGRLLITLFLVERDLLPRPLLYLSAFFEQTRQQYYHDLSAVQRRGAWSGWLEYFLRGVTLQAGDALGRIERLQSLLESWRNMVADLPSRIPSSAIDLLAANPYCSVKRMAQQLGVAFTTAQRAVTKLQELEILSETTQARRDRIYCAKELLRILEEPMDLR